VEGIATDVVQFCKGALAHSIKVPGRSRATLHFPGRGGKGRQIVSSGGGFDPRLSGREIEGQAGAMSQWAWKSKGVLFYYIL
jgi:hypothetical protein